MPQKSPCCQTPSVVWNTAWSWRCLACNRAGTQETAVIGDPWGLARRPTFQTVQVHANEAYTRGYLDGRAAGAWEMLKAAATP